MCPHCHKDAPVLYRGVVPYCTACGAQRAPLTGASVNLAGKPAKVGGTVASAAGVMALIIGLGLALMIAGVASALGATTLLILALSGPVAVLSITIGALLLVGGSSLRKTGAVEAQRTREQGIFALAANRGGLLRAADVAVALGMTPEEADAELTALAKQKGDRVTLEIDDNGGLYYRFINEMGAPRVRVPPYAASGPRVSPPSGPAVIDGEFEEAETEAGGAVRRAQTGPTRVIR